MGGTSLVLDHVAKGGRLYGSVYKSNVPREVIKVSRSRGDVLLVHKKANNRAKVAPIRLRVSFDGADGPIRYALSADRPSQDDEVPSLYQRVRAVITDDPSVTNAQLHVRIAAPANPDTVDRYAAQVRKESRNGG
jgi:hypothetical protein